MLADGIAFIADLPFLKPIGDNLRIVITTGHAKYSIRDCIDRRNFAAHGSRSQQSGVVLDQMLAIRLLCILVAGLGGC